MRLKVSLEPQAKNYLIPINYQYQLSSAVYNVMRMGSEEYATWLHEVGYSDESGKRIKLFSFSNLYFENYQIIGNEVRTDGKAHFYFSTPYETKSMDVFVQGIMKNQDLSLRFNKSEFHYFINSVEIIKPPKFDEEMTYKLITPMTVSTMIEINNERKVYYIRPDDNRFIDAIKSNLFRKFRLLHHKEYCDILKISIVEPNRISSKLIHIKEGRTDETQIKGFLMKLLVQCNNEMHQLIYDAGIGIQNSMGFGMVEILR